MFDSGRVKFCRFRAVGDAPSTVDETTLATLAEYAFRETEIGEPQEVESGWITGEHLYDTQFSYEKNGYGDVLIVGLRIDTNKVPSEVKRAYKMMNVAAAAAGNPSGFASRAQKKDAADEANRQMHEDLAAGKFRRSKIIPVAWDLRHQTVLCGADGSTAVEELARQFKQSFNVELEPLTAGALAGLWLRENGRTRDYEDLQPSAFTEPPAQATRDADDDDKGPARGDLSVPSVPWVAAATDTKDFIGNEMLIWLWWQVATNEGLVKVPGETGPVELAILVDKTLDMHCAWDATGRTSVRADGPLTLPESIDALREGKWPRKFGLILSDGECQWELTLQADRMTVSGAALPKATEEQSPREVVEHRLLMTRRLVSHLDALFTTFLKLRTGGGWPATKRRIREWIGTLN